MVNAPETDLARGLHELIAALDRRVPRAAHAGETAIAGDAAALRAQAVLRLQAIETSPPSAGDAHLPPRDQDGAARR